MSEHDLLSERDDLLLRLERAEDTIEAQRDHIKAQDTLIQRMALRLDELEPPRPITVEWSGSAAAYWDNSGAVNHEIALELQRALSGAANTPNTVGNGPQHPGALNASPQRSLHATEGAIDAQAVDGEEHPVELDSGPAHDPGRGAQLPRDGADHRPAGNAGPRTVGSPRCMIAASGSSRATVAGPCALSSPS